MCVRILLDIERKRKYVYDYVLRWEALWTDRIVVKAVFVIHYRGTDHAKCNSMQIKPLLATKGIVFTKCVHL